MFLNANLIADKNKALENGHYKSNNSNAIGL